MFPGYFLVPLAALAHHTRAGRAWRRPWVPVFNDDAGYYFLLDCDSGEILRYDNDEAEAYLVHRDLVRMLETVLAGYEEGVYSWDPAVGLLSDIDREWSLARRMNPGIEYWER